MKTYPFTKEGMAELVAWLASDPPAVLAAEKLTGKRGSDTEDVVSNFIRAAVPDLDSVTVTYAHAHLSRSVAEVNEYGHSDTRYEALDVLLPDPVVDFLEEFDNGEHPELEASDAVA